MSDIADKEQAWSFVTLARIRPAMHHRGRGMMEYRITSGDAEENANTYKVLELEIPFGADPGLVHNNASGFIPFTFNEVFDMDAKQEDVFSYIQDMVLDIFDGINSTVLAYGQTGSGKTYSMCGGDSFEDRGLIPRALSVVFEEVSFRLESENSSYKCLISFTEVLGETVYDLLDPQKHMLPLEKWSKVQVLEGEDGLMLRNLNVFEVNSEEDALNLFFMGSTNRTTSSTPMNQASSRSHAIFTIIMECEFSRGDRTLLKSGKINFVDLAGSERLYKSDNTHAVVKEGRSINLSLHFLEQVIVSLRDLARKATNSKTPRANGFSRLHSSASYAADHNRSWISAPTTHIPYRNSVLTNILRDSLGGNCKSCFLLTMSAEAEFFEETVSTARFGQRCGEIQVKVKANLEIDLRSQLQEALQRAKHLEHQIMAIEESKGELQRILHEKDSTLRHSIDEDTRPLTDEESSSCESIGEKIVSSIKGLPVGDIESVNSIVSAELSGLRKPMLLSVVAQIGTNLFQAYQENSLRAENRLLTHPRMMHLRSMSNESKDDDNISSRFNSYRSITDTPPPTGIDPHCRTMSIDTNTLFRSTKSDDISTAPTVVRDPAAMRPGISRKLRPLIEGTTVISHGSFGSYKVKYLSLTSDCKYMTWKDMLDKRDPKVVLITGCSSFQRIETKHLKTPGGAVLSFSDPTNKVHEFEFPAGNLSEEENIRRVQRWADLLSDLKMGRKSLLENSSSASSRYFSSSPKRSDEYIHRQQTTSSTLVSDA
mmetsp:Transcript_18695/g.27048  ORF Transcript_18695/g.27048 Transcript_18695/m.27048 type:complete len:769 (-) Transcript_18695:208-2514(-)|eukprot:CAMPEP_0185032696 /NCGR_PEP_ID=MMETSP1103-20130426/20997_1 /TAXON_ID=36769 /ORGANISM="Paraphysomonas bandaiensis, Strain Caron Lab Isolate" /LENGTH=768 /DNA_ID=CAMNT_0027568683 /DNA_START=97 /DNA_END=2403 /DNA_ORIENTATION=-